MSLLVDLMLLYERQGYTVVCGLDSFHSGRPDTEYACLMKDGIKQSEHLGIAQKELYFLESALRPQRSSSHARPWVPRGVLVVGNGFGWTSFALSMLCLKASVVVVESGEQVFTFDWIGRTNHMADSEGLKLKVVQGASPYVLSTVFGEGGALEDIPLDLVFLDGACSAEQIRADLLGLLPHMNPQTVILCHNAVANNLAETIDALAQEHRLKSFTLWATPSGMKVLTGPRPPLALLQAVHAFGAGPTAQMVLKSVRETTVVPAVGRIVR